MAKRKTTVYLDPDLRLATKAVATASNRTESEVIAEALRGYLEGGRAAEAREELSRLMSRWAQRTDQPSDDDAAAIALAEVRGHRQEQPGDGSRPQ
ncbi:MAG: CopG family transcriptional regulator [Candidatus Dormibacteria bacterium]